MAKGKTTARRMEGDEEQEDKKDVEKSTDAKGKGKGKVKEVQEGTTKKDSPKSGKKESPKSADKERAPKEEGAVKKRVSPRLNPRPDKEEEGEESLAAAASDDEEHAKKGRTRKVEKKEESEESPKTPTKRGGKATSSSPGTKSASAAKAAARKLELERIALEKSKQAFMVAARVEIQRQMKEQGFASRDDYAKYVCGMYRPTGRLQIAKKNLHHTSDLRKLKDTAVEDLVESMKTHGYDDNYPLLVVKMSDEEKKEQGIEDDEEHYWVYDGNTRLASAMLIPEIEYLSCKVVHLLKGFTSIPAEHSVILCGTENSKAQTVRPKHILDDIWAMHQLLEDDDDLPFDAPLKLRNEKGDINPHMVMIAMRTVSTKKDTKEGDKATTQGLAHITVMIRIYNGLHWNAFLHAYNLYLKQKDDTNDPWSEAKLLCTALLNANEMVQIECLTKIAERELTSADAVENWCIRETIQNYYNEVVAASPKLKVGPEVLRKDFYPQFHTNEISKTPAKVAETKKKMQKWLTAFSANNFAEMHANAMVKKEEKEESEEDEPGTRRTKSKLVDLTVAEGREKAAVLYNVALAVRTAIVGMNLSKVLNRGAFTYRETVPDYIWYQPRTDMVAVGSQTQVEVELPDLIQLLKINSKAILFVVAQNGAALAEILTAFNTNEEAPNMHYIYCFPVKNVPKNQRSMDFPKDFNKYVIVYSRSTEAPPYVKEAHKWINQTYYHGCTIPLDPIVGENLITVGKEKTVLMPIQPNKDMYRFIFLFFMQKGKLVLDVYPNVGGCAYACIRYGLRYHALEISKVFADTAPLAVSQYVKDLDIADLNSWMEDQGFDCDNVKVKLTKEVADHCRSGRILYMWKQINPLANPDLEELSENVWTSACRNVEYENFPLTPYRGIAKRAREEEGTGKRAAKVAKVVRKKGAEPEEQAEEEGEEGDEDGDEDGDEEGDEEEDEEEGDDNEEGDEEGDNDRGGDGDDGGDAPEPRQTRKRDKDDDSRGGGSGEGRKQKGKRPAKGKKRDNESGEEGDSEEVEAVEDFGLDLQSPPQDYDNDELELQPDGWDEEVNDTPPKNKQRRSKRSQQGVELQSREQEQKSVPHTPRRTKTHVRQLELQPEDQDEETTPRTPAASPYEKSVWEGSPDVVSPSLSPNEHFHRLYRDDEARSRARDTNERYDREDQDDFAETKPVKPKKKASPTKAPPSKSKTTSASVKVPLAPSQVKVPLATKSPAKEVRLKARPSRPEPKGKSPAKPRPTRYKAIPSVGRYRSVASKRGAIAAGKAKASEVIKGFEEEYVRPFNGRQTTMSTYITAH